MKKKVLIIMSICVLIIIIFLLLYKRNIIIYMESTPSSPNDTIDLKITIDNTVIFDDTLHRNPYSFPTHIEYPMRIGFHTISVSSEKVNFYGEEKVFLFFNQYIYIMYLGVLNDSKPIFNLSTGYNPFQIM